ncbi:SRPBCC family protein [Acidisphaera rubrifaciens]|uniref:Polyketide cyclase/dehydrase n=1 Tax=Acidisphaera rubrifaciens HS-AP3 TaxID=1231350 RepID=A0A0D6P572_9PROT|nr:SRPBCC family protein [Acidisphaera rubrifaciens]GAN76802.1 polyketide cyclase/dehydrase [Acidisphaera rubrifaciens HS-AP3]
MAEVYVSAVIDAPAGAVWGVIRDFNALPAWTPFVVESRIERNQPAAQVGCVRVFRLRDGGMIRERLLALSDYEFSMTYSILESPMAVEGYVATLRLLPVTQGNKAFAEWSASFRCAEAREGELVDHIGRNVFLAGLVALQRRPWPAA